MEEARSLPLWGEQCGHGGLGIPASKCSPAPKSKRFVARFATLVFALSFGPDSAYLIVPTCRCEGLLGCRCGWMRGDPEQYVSRSQIAVEISSSVPIA